MGTAAYMSPEQARAKQVDKRADIWAFGVCLFEALAGRRPFEGDDATDILGSILKLDPKWDALPPGLPTSVHRLLRRCLQKDARRRLRDIGDARLDIEERSDDTESGSASIPTRARQVTPWILVAAMGLVTIGLLLRGAGPSPDRTTRRFPIDLPWQTVSNWGDFRVAISPDGTHFAYHGRHENRVEIYLRPLDSLEALPISGPASPQSVAFSPDGKRLAFESAGELRTVSIQGGQPDSVLQLPEGAWGLSWGADDNILLGGADGLSKVPASGGDRVPVTPVQDADTQAHGNPTHLPGGGHALFTIYRPEDSRLAVADLVAGTFKELSLRGAEPLYSPSGHLLFLQGNELWAAPFDLDELELTSEPVFVLDGIAYGPRLADDGTLAYVAQRADGNARLVWVDRNGQPTAIRGERRDYSHIDLSTDGRYALLNVRNIVSLSSVYVSDLARGTRSLVTSNGGMPIWAPDGAHATFRRVGAIVAKMADGSADEQRLLSVRAVPTSWSPDGECLAFFDRADDVWVLPRDGEPTRLLGTPASERSARFSPDGKWLAYVSDETGEFQVYVIPFPGPGPRIPVSVDGGLSPIWSSDGKELFFRRGSKVIAASVEPGEELRFSPPVELFDGPYTLDIEGHQRYDVAPDGRFLMVENSEDFRVVIVEGFFEELNRLAPPP